MKETILALLIAKFSGVRKDCLVAMARSMALHCATEDDAKALVDKITDAQVNEFVKEHRADVDKEVSSSNKAFESNLKKKYEFKERKAEPGGDPDPDPSDISKIVEAAVAKAVAPFQEKLSNYEKGDLAKSRLQALTDKLATCKDETFKAQTLKDFARMSFDSDDAFNEYLTEKEADISTANQNLADAALRNGGGSPLFSQKEETGISKGVADYIASQSTENNSFSGKEL